MSTICETCKCGFMRKQHYKRHLTSKRHILKQELLICSPTIETTKHVCFSCNKSFVFASGLSKHKLKCEPYISSDQVITNNGNELEIIKKQLSDQQNTIEDERKKNQEERERHEKERNELRSQINMLLEKHASNHSTTNNTQNIETQNNHITIQINAFGNENIDYLDDKTISKCIERVYKSIPALIEKIHFHPDHPENHNIKITNKKLPYATVMGNNQKWKTVDRKDAIETMVHNGYNLLEEKYPETRSMLTQQKQERFDAFRTKYENDDKCLRKQLKQEVELMVLNGGQ